MYISRFEKITETMKAQEIRVAAVCAGPLLEYFTGLYFHISERPAVLIIKDHKDPAFIFPRFEREKVDNSPIKMQLFPYDENQDSMIQAFRDSLIYLETDHAVGVEPQSFRFHEMDIMQKAMPNLKFVSAAKMFEHIFICKDREEIESIQKAVEIAESALMKTISQFSEGMTEKKLANQLVINLLEDGSDPLLPFLPIVASGPNSANPHAIASDRQIKNGDLVIVDWGARYNGYVSDITRTFAVGKVEEKLKNMAQIVLEANCLARDSIKAGIRAKEIDHTARTHISNSGFGDYFLHRTGHGIGLKEHETPYISQTDDTMLQEGMVFTVEPGIYFAGLGGIRIEDDVAVTESGSKTLTSLPGEIVYLE